MSKGNQLEWLLSLVDSVHKQRIVSDQQRVVGLGTRDQDSPSLLSNDASDTQRLTLHQCVPVHEAILDATHIHDMADDLEGGPSLLKNTMIHRETSVSDEALQDDDDSFFLHEVLQVLLRRHDEYDTGKATCRRILSDPNAIPTHTLITCQFLLRLVFLNTRNQLSSTGIILIGIDLILLPILFHCTHLKTETVDVLIDAAFLYRHSINDNSSAELDRTLLQRTTAHINYRMNRILTSPLHHHSSSMTYTYNRIKVLLEWGSRMQSRLLLLSYPPSFDAQDIILNAILDLTLDILSSICYYTTRPLLVNGRVDLARPVTAILLPILYPIDTTQHLRNVSESQRRIMTMWDFLVSILRPMSTTTTATTTSTTATILQHEEVGHWKKPISRNWIHVAYSIVSSVLCIITPAFSTILLPNPLNRSSLLPLNQQSIVWEFLLTSLGKNSSDLDGKWSGGRIGLSSRGKSSSIEDAEEDNSQPIYFVDQVIRRRAIHILNLFLDQSTMKKAPKTILWTKYVMAFEALEMETELHLVDQVYPTLIELCSACVADTNNDSGESNLSSFPPPLSWSWMGALLARVLLSDAPTLRKFALFRFLMGNTGIEVPPVQNPTEVHKASTGLGQNSTVFMSKPQKKNNVKVKSGRMKDESKPAPLSILSPSFVLSVVFRGFDSLGQCAGTGINYECDGKIISDDLKRLIEPFITHYLQALEPYPEKLKAFFSIMFSDDFINPEHTRTKNLVLLFRGASKVWNNDRFESLLIPMEIKNLEEVVSSFRLLLHNGSTTGRQRVALLQSLAKILSHSKMSDGTKPDPILLLRTFSLFSYSTFNLELEDTAIEKSLLLWLRNTDADWAIETARYCTEAFVSGHLLPDNIAFRERDFGLAITKLCSLVGQLSPQISAASLLWPAIEKGLDCNEDSLVTRRALTLLEGGCYEHGSLLPPPSNIADILTLCTSILIDQIRGISMLCDESNSGNVAPVRSSACRDIDNHFSGLIRQCIVLRTAFPSCISTLSSLSVLVCDFLNNLNTDTNQQGDLVINFALCFACLSLGEFRVLGGGPTILKYCFQILDADICAVDSSRRFKIMRSIFQYAKWGTLGRIIPRLSAEDVSSLDLIRFNEILLQKAKDSVSSASSSALLPLFEAVASSNQIVMTLTEPFAPSSIRLMIDTLSNAMVDISSNSVRAHMLEILCSLIFRGKLLLDEYACWEGNNKIEDVEEYPILSTFRSLISQSLMKPHIAKTVLCYITSAWLFEFENKDDIGLSAIMYRTDICQLIVSKEFKERNFVEKLETNFHFQDSPAIPSVKTVLPKGVDELSVARGFILVFLSKLPEIKDGINLVVLRELCHFIIFWLLDNICTVKPKSGSLLVTGSREYCEKIRAWQALCLLSRFVTPDVVNQVFQKVFDAVSQNMHGQIRYFVEVFTIKCAQCHSIVLEELIMQFKSPYLSLQHVSSLMIIAGNLLVGSRYSTSITKKSYSNDMLIEITACVIPWLSSTQGFTRAIAQLLCYKLIPLLIQCPNSTSIQDIALKSIWTFLDLNPDMERLRKKQEDFFDGYDVYSICLPEGLLQIPVDKGGEPNPPHFVDLLKKCLDEVYLESRECDTPNWKQIEALIDAMDETVIDDANSENALNLQRKILPLDSLQLSLEEYVKARQMNAVGRSRQNLIVCASLIDKTPNLAGLARTAEIFAVDRLVIPNLKQTLMDNFNSISVGAQDWVKIEECKEENLRPWLNDRKEEGYSIVGVEQTSSSNSLPSFKFPEKCVLLLGKEKEGIPIELLQLVDSCIEIPQLGIIRSLNVHVTGAIVIWEYTKQHSFQVEG